MDAALRFIEAVGRVTLAIWERLVSLVKGLLVIVAWLFGIYCALVWLGMGYDKYTDHQAVKEACEIIAARESSYDAEFEVNYKRCVRK